MYGSRNIKYWFLIYDEIVNVFFDVQRSLGNYRIF